ncbi:MAG: hypothetical protein ACPGXK_13415 [Phycisphaerae bacterium]
MSNASPPLRSHLDVGQASTTASLSMSWIVGPRTDLLCFIGAAVLGYGMFFLHAGLALDMIFVWLVWYMFLDAPHFFGTYSRTYFDKQEMKTRRTLLLGSLALPLVGPTILLSSYLLFAAGMSWYKVPFLFFTAFVSLWAYWHVVRQHYGIMGLYNRKNETDQSLFDRRLDQIVLYVGLLAPLAAFSLRNEEARTVFGLSTRTAEGVLTSPYVATGWPAIVVNLSFGLAVGALALGVGRQLYRYLTGSVVNVPKLLFFVALIPLHITVCFHPAASTLALLGFSACVTIFHDVQYHAIVWYYQKNRLARAGDDAKEQLGWAARFGASFPTYMVFAIGMGLFLGLAGCMLDITPGCIPVFASRDVAVFGKVGLNELMFSFVLGVLMHHYFVDQFIWRPSKDKGMREDLKLQKPVS